MLSFNGGGVIGRFAICRIGCEDLKWLNKKSIRRNSPRKSETILGQIRLEVLWLIKLADVESLCTCEVCTNSIYMGGEIIAFCFVYYRTPAQSLGGFIMFVGSNFNVYILCSFFILSMWSFCRECLSVHICIPIFIAEADFTSKMILKVYAVVLLSICNWNMQEAGCGLYGCILLPIYLDARSLVFHCPQLVGFVWLTLALTVKNIEMYAWNCTCYPHVRHFTDEMICFEIQHFHWLNLSGYIIWRGMKSDMLNDISVIQMEYRRQMYFVVHFPKILVPYYPNSPPCMRWSR